MSASRFLFVVKNPDSKSFSRSDVSESRSIHRHAQISSIHQKQSSGQSRDSSQQIPFIEVKPKIRRSRSSKGADVKSKKTSRENSSQQLLNLRLLCCCFGARRRPCPIHSIPRVPAHEEHVIDPFASTGVSIDRKAHSLLQYFIQVSHPRTWHSEVQRDRSYTFARDAQTLVRESFEHEVHFYSLLASMASQMQHFDRTIQDESGNDALATKAISTVRRYLQTDPPIVQRLIFDIHQLAVIEFYRYQLESARVHLSAVKALLPHVGGIEGIDHSLREWIVIGDGYLSAELLSKPLFPASCFDPGHFSLDKEFATRSLTGQFLQNQTHLEFIPAKMLAILHDTIAAVQVHEQQSQMSAFETRASGESKATLHWLLLRTTALRHRLLELDMDDDRLDAIRIALMGWLFLVMTVTGRQRTCKVLSTKLRLLLQTTIRKGYWAENEEFLLWVLLTGAMCSSILDRVWFLTAVRQLQRHPGPTSQATRSPQGFVTLCKRFFYVEKVQEPMLRTCITDLNALPHITILDGS